MQRPADLFSWKNLSAILVVLVSVILVLRIVSDNRKFFINPEAFSIQSPNGLYLSITGNFLLILKHFQFNLPMDFTFQQMHAAGKLRVQAAQPSDIGNGSPLPGGATGLLLFLIIPGKHLDPENFILSLPDQAF